MPVPTVEAVKRLLTEHHFDSKGKTARRLVLQARDVIEQHLRNAWARKTVVVRGQSELRTVCGCRYCEEWAAIAEIDLPIEQVDPATRPQPARGFQVRVARVTAEDLYRTSNRLEEIYDIVRKPGERDA